VLANDTDADGDPLTATVMTQPQNGTLTLNADGSFNYTPTPGYSGSDSFVYQASDGTISSNPTTVTLTINAVNHAPVAAADSYTVAQDATLTVPADQGVLANDTDIDNDTLHAILVQQPANGSVTLNDDGSFTYVPTTGFSGTDTFTYQASDGTDTSAETTVTITIDPASGESSSSIALANDAALMALLSGA
jgi:VCBS repeat-containing protein